MPKGTFTRKTHRHAGATMLTSGPPEMPMLASAVSGWIVSRTAAPTKGPAAMPRNVSAPMMPRARGRAGPSKRCEAAAVATGMIAPPPTAWTRRAAIS